ncbi:MULTISPECIES: hypothetical protein [unclassified Sphingomonas]|uniref:hypothetical protein n=1 Tax=unclassified Sphingomonas TaxID=196159 RepID=UPI00226A0A94|nr:MULTISPECIES: hypothetical protein [unclassified Sphingomonas]
MIKRIVFAAIMVASPPASAQRAELPVRLVALPNGDRRFATTLTIDGRSVEVGIDTGSTGLRVLPRGLGGRTDTPAGPKVIYRYDVGTAIEGEAVVVPVAAGPIAGPVKLMRIAAIGCTPDHPDCPAARAILSTYGIQSDGIAGQGFAAILGIRLKHEEIDNPFAQLGIRRWIVELPRSATEQGRIVLNPTDAEIAGYARIAVDRDGTTPGCLVGPQRICGRAFFDSGAAGLRVLRDAPFRPWANGTPATISVGSGAATRSITVTIGRRDQASGLFYARRDGDTRLSLGFAPYFRWSVLYDTDEREVGVKPR